MDENRNKVVGKITEQGHVAHSEQRSPTFCLDSSYRAENFTFRFAPSHKCVFGRTVKYSHKYTPKLSQEFFPKEVKLHSVDDITLNPMDEAWLSVHIYVKADE